MLMWLKAIPVIIALVLGAGGGGYILWLQKSKAELKSENANLSAAVDRATEIAKNNADVATRMEAKYRDTIQKLNEANDQISHTRKNVALLRERIKNASENENGPLAPIYVGALNQLLEWQRSKDFNANKGSSTGNTGKPVDLRPRP